eukprot:Hpha_TRINITY_DN29911_c0_g1::TRINITY_DN29911_c0_g1_i1::g.131872::m.131872/K07964/HPSE; heparanase
MLGVWGAVVALGAAGARVNVSVDVSASVFDTAAEYVSFNIDASGWRKMDLSAGNQRLDLLARSLTPAHLRVGGTQQDYDIYAVGEMKDFTCAQIPPSEREDRCATMSETQWATLIEFCGRNNLTLVFGLSDMFGRGKLHDSSNPVCTSKKCAPRNHTNLQALLRHTMKAHPTAPIHGFELGNELNDVLTGEVGAHAQADDFAALRSWIESNWAGGKLRVIGPDTHSYSDFSPSGREWMKWCAERVQRNISAWTFHEYSLGSGPNLKPSTYLDPAELDRSGEGGGYVRDIVDKAIGEDMEVWAGETAAANKGGAKNI